MSGILLEMIFCEIILKGDVFYRPIVSEHKYFIEKTTICCEWIKSLVSELSLVGALRDPWSYPHSYRGGCVYEGWGPMGDVHAQGEGASSTRSVPFLSAVCVCVCVCVGLCH